MGSSERSSKKKTPVQYTLRKMIFRTRSSFLCKSFFRDDKQDVSSNQKEKNPKDPGKAKPTFFSLLKENSIKN